MSERYFLVVGAIFLIALATAMTRLGRGRGGAAWAAAWTCLYVSGLASTLETDFPVIRPLVPFFGTCFAALLFYGVGLFTERSQRYVPKLIAATLAVSIARVVVRPFISEGASQILGSVVIIAGVVACCLTLLFPRGRDHTLWERGLAIGFPAIAVVSGYYSWSKYAGVPVPPAILGWLVTGILMGSLKTGAFIALATARLESLQQEATRSLAVRDEFAARYREVTEQASDMISELDARGTILYANPAHEAVLGISAENLIGREAGSLAFSEQQGAIYGPGAERNDGQTQIFIVRHADGRPVTLEAVFRRFVGLDGQERIVLTSRDVTARVADEREREAVRKELEDLVQSRTDELRSSIHALEESQRLASLGTMAAGIAHQINNPVGSIQMSAEFALGAKMDDPNREEVWRDALENAVDQARRCGRIVASMLQFARNEPTEKRREDLGAILRRACELTERYASARGTTIDSGGVTGSLPIQGSAIELEQAFLNMLRNAVEASRRGQTVRVDTHRAARHAIVQIADEGKGMLPQEVDQVLDPFFTTRLEVGGTGLGLSVAHGVITDHEGLLAIESTPDVGTTLTVTLPLA